MATTQWLACHWDASQTISTVSMPLRRRADRHAFRFGLSATARGLAVPPVQTQIQDRIRFEIIYDLAINRNCEAIYEVFPPDWLLRSLATLIVVITTVAATN